MLQDSKHSNDNNTPLERIKKTKAERIALSKKMKTNNIRTSRNSYLQGYIWFNLFQILLLTFLFLQVMRQGMIFQDSKVSTHCTGKQSHENDEEEEGRGKRQKEKVSIQMLGFWSSTALLKPDKVSTQRAHLCPAPQPWNAHHWAAHSQSLCSLPCRLWTWPAFLMPCYVPCTCLP